MASPQGSAIVELPFLSTNRIMKKEETEAVMALLEDYILNRGSNPEAFGLKEYMYISECMVHMDKIQTFVIELMKRLKESKEKPDQLVEDMPIV